ncbi:zf-HC2 domain-containing protein [Dermabacter sp. p3-SID358]|uniref:zf-HC2 domain-containing protein n=1 Tax=Dermabacter sp. p3-SID358 TaxID=2916114 RepID=UPI0021A8CCFA|nr:zf-HC2 domain-containing protein [Dermabacter sp. p3-SID358]MCT1867682.1 zf-HC2 domain-containing protein [Dermabacter sp. p3-SID358]
MCDPALERLMNRVDRALRGRLSDSEAVELENHLGECAACAREIEQARLVRQLLRSSCAGRASEELRERVRGSARTLTYREVRVSYGSNGSVRRESISMTRTIEGPLHG